MGEDPGRPTLAEADRTDDSIELFEIATVSEPVRTWRATAGHLAIGSHPANAVVLDEPTVSRFHCELSAGPRGVELTDLDSRNGTFVDGVRIRAAILADGNLIRIGPVRLRFRRLGHREPVEHSPHTTFGPLVASSPIMRALFATLERAAKSDATVLIEGETGTGKGAVAEALHTASARHDRPFVVVDCGVLSPTLLESELFGHERGAFTGADARRVGAFEEASGGTIFLDEVGELPADMQPRLLRVLENRTVRRLGQNRYQAIDVRIIAATNRDLRTLVNEGRFRADLYYRLGVVRVRIPPLRERLSDLPELTDRLLRGLGAAPAEIAELTAPSVIERLRQSAWPGNVRELRNFLESSLVLDSPALDELPASADATLPLPEARRRALEAFERRYLEDLLRRHGGKVAAAARAAGVARIYIYRLLSRHGLRPTGEPRD